MSWGFLQILILLVLILIVWGPFLKRLTRKGAGASSSARTPAQFCPHCGAPRAPHAKFCSACGRPLDFIDV